MPFYFCPIYPFYPCPPFASPPYGNFPCQISVTSHHPLCPPCGILCHLPRTPCHCLCQLFCPPSQGLHSGPMISALAGEPVLWTFPVRGEYLLTVSASSGPLPVTNHLGHCAHCLTGKKNCSFSRLDLGLFADCLSRFDSSGGSASPHLKMSEHMFDSMIHDVVAILKVDDICFLSEMDRNYENIYLLLYRVDH